MINRATVPMWGNARKSAGPPKWAGKRTDCPIRGTDPVARIRFYLHKEFRAGKIQLGAMLMKMAGFIKENALRAFDDC